MYWKRLLEDTINKARETFPVIVITGARQTGKSTLLKEFLKNNNPTIINLDDPSFRRLLQDNPLEYLKTLKKPIIIDEIQYMPELASYIKIIVDNNRIPGQWFLTGSQQFSVMKNISDSLAGRAAILSLPTFQIDERKKINKIGDYLISSSYPEPCVNIKVNNDLWYSSYLQTYIERDVRALLNIENIRDFESFIRLIAANTAQELNMSRVSSDLGVSVPTVKRWLSVLEASYIIYLLPPYHSNFGKRIVKSPKIFFYDNGFVNYLLGIKDSEFLLKGPMAGPLFENAVIMEIVKLFHSRGIKPFLYFWRSQSGIEVDLIIETNVKHIPCEIKLSSSLKKSFYKNINYWLELSGQKDSIGYLITNCNENLPIPQNIKNIYWKKIANILE